MRPRQQPVVHRCLVCEVEPGPGSLDGIQIADHVRDGHIRRCELLYVASGAGTPRHGHPTPSDRARATICTYRRDWIVVNLTTRDNGHLLVEQPGHRPEQPALCLAAKTQQDEIVTGQDGVDDLRDNRFIVTDDAREEAVSRTAARGIRATRFSRISSFTERRLIRPAAMA